MLALSIVHSNGLFARMISHLRAFVSGSFLLFMKILCWNVQGAKKPHFPQEVGYIKRTVNPDILILLETMVNDCTADRIVKSLGYQFYDTIPTFNQTGGIWVLWNTVNVDVTVMAKEDRVLPCVVYEKSTAKQVLLSAVYAPANPQDKDAFWAYLKKVSDTIDLPWCLIGDFNEMLLSSEKIGGTPLTVSKTKRLSDFLAYSRGIDANVQGRIFT